MSESINDGGPAFACGVAAPDGEKHLQEGMSLRDWFAATIPLTQLDIDIMLTDPHNAFIAEAQIRYMKADAMLAMKPKPK